MTDDRSSSDGFSTTKSHPWSAKGANTRRTILSAAITRFGREGFRATSVTDIARDAGVSGTAAYAYFPNKEALFLAAVDEDAAGVVAEGMANITDQPHLREWPSTAFLTVLAALDNHPLAYRLFSAMEPEVTRRVLDIPALLEVRKDLAKRLGDEQELGLVNDMLDPQTMANGLVTIMISLISSVVQLGVETTAYAEDVTALLHSAIAPRSGAPSSF